MSFSTDDIYEVMAEEISRGSGTTLAGEDRGFQAWRHDPGGKRGRPTVADDKQQKILLLLKKGLSRRRIAMLVGVNRNTVNKYAK